MGPWKLISALVVNVMLIVILPRVMESFGMIEHLAPGAIPILFVTAMGLCIKIVVGDFVAGKFLYHKHGYDFCLMTLASSITGWSLQFMAEKDLFPAAGSIWPLSLLYGMTEDPVKARLYSLFAIMLLAS